MMVMVELLTTQRHSIYAADSAEEVYGKGLPFVKPLFPVKLTTSCADKVGLFIVAVIVAFRILM